MKNTNLGATSTGTNRQSKKTVQEQGSFSSSEEDWDQAFEEFKQSSKQGARLSEADPDGKKKRKLVSLSNWQQWYRRARQYQTELLLAGFLICAILGLLILKTQEERYALGSNREVSIDPYSVLGVPSNSSQSDIRRAYRNLSIKWHPDRNPNCSECTGTYEKILKAFALIGETKQREFYDRTYGGRLHKILSSTPEIDVNFWEQRIASSSDIWVVQVCDEYHGGCVELAPIWESAATKYGGFIKFVRVNGSAHPKILKKLPVAIKLYPTVLLLKDGASVTLYDAALRPTTESFEKFIETNIPPLAQSFEPALLDTAETIMFAGNVVFYGALQRIPLWAQYVAYALENVRGVFYGAQVLVNRAKCVSHLALNGRGMLIAGRGHVRRAELADPQESTQILLWGLYQRLVLPIESRAAALALAHEDYGQYIVLVVGSQEHWTTEISQANSIEMPNGTLLSSAEEFLDFSPSSVQTKNLVHGIQVISAPEPELFSPLREFLDQTIGNARGLLIDRKSLVYSVLPLTNQVANSVHSLIENNVFDWTPLPGKFDPLNPILRLDPRANTLASKVTRYLSSWVH